MAQKIIRKTHRLDNVKKPHEILELEKIFNIEMQGFDIGILELHGNSFSLNSKGEVISLSFENYIVKDLKQITICKNIEFLNLTINRVEDISPLKIYKDLKKLYLGGNKVKDIRPLLKFKQLNQLTVWENPIDDYSILGQLHELKELYCQELKITDLNFIKDLKKLKVLNADRNLIDNIDIIESLDNLTSLSFTDNKIKIIPRSIAERFNWTIKLIHERVYIEDRFLEAKIMLLDNPLQFPPASVIELGAETTKNYFETSALFGHAPLSEGRIIFVGDGSSGKSSIIEKILRNTFEKGREQTNGIHIEHFNLHHQEDKRELNFHIWDFGGQEIQHAVHKFFFTEGCLYILVLDNRKEEDPEYWLQQIESLGGKAPVLVVLNKQDENAAETVDRKYLKEKYPNIVGFYKTSCFTGFGIPEFKNALEQQAVKLGTVDEQFPNNWLLIKKAIESKTSGSHHYLMYDSYKEICDQNHTKNEAAQKLLLKYFNTIGAVTWFGDDINLNLLHILNPKWITQGVYKIITSKKTANLFGRINISDFKELLQPQIESDYAYDENHYAYILNMMIRFQLCDSSDNIHLLIPSAFGKEPKVEYKEFKGENIRTYILQFKDYMPLAIIHRYTTKNISLALDNNYWYTGIVIKDSKSDSYAMVHADKGDKRIYVRIKGENKLGLWEHIRREIHSIVSSYAKIQYDELVYVDEMEGDESVVKYDDLVSHIQAKKEIYFHPKLKRDFNVGYLIGLFETKEGTLDKVKKGIIPVRQSEQNKIEKVPTFVINILNQSNPVVNTAVNNQIIIDIDIKLVNNLSSDVKGNANYLIEELKKSNKELKDDLQKIVQFANDAKSARSSGEVKEKGWARKLKNVIQSLGKSGEAFKNIQDGGEALKSLFKGVNDLAHQFNLTEVIELFSKMPNAF